MNQNKNQEIEEEEETSFEYPKRHFSDAWGQIKDDFSHPFFVVLFCILMIISLWGMLIQPNRRVRKATEASLIAFLIAYLARLDLVFIAATLVFLLVFFGRMRDHEENYLTASQDLILSLIICFYYC